jgi:hypothetical protein
MQVARGIGLFFSFAGAPGRLPLMQQIEAGQLIQAYKFIICMQGHACFYIHPLEHHFIYISYPFIYGMHHGNLM